MCLSVPCVVNGTGVARRLDIAMSAEETAGLPASGDAVRAVAASVGLVEPR